ncbi:MAG: hypothetical protein COW42_08965 [Deltaproteobacteria bacterium CG17_big_fil_post_rev_8_21_14_2_50_63_7]|nr:MAG: hypothetical protein COW42_08965 [Deltaproteobacteria bacterium CG17_big_fil_post_rev_8_21_14_2_50_63_7]
MAISVTSDARPRRSTSGWMVDRVATPSFWIVVALVLHLAVALTAGAVAQNHSSEPPKKQEAKLSFVKVDLPKEPEPPKAEIVEKKVEEKEAPPIVEKPQEPLVEKKEEEKPKEPEKKAEPKRKPEVKKEPKKTDPEPTQNQETFVNFGAFSGSTAGSGTVAVSVGDSAAGAIPQQQKEKTTAKPKPKVEVSEAQEGAEDGGEPVVVSRKKLSRKAEPKESYNRKIKAEYPPELLAAGVEADVILIATVKADGGVSKLEVVNVVDERFVTAAKRAVMKFKFAPALEDDEPVASEFRIVYRFRLDDY